MKVSEMDMCYYLVKSMDYLLGIIGTNLINEMSRFVDNKYAEFAITNAINEHLDIDRYRYKDKIHYEIVDRAKQMKFGQQTGLNGLFTAFQSEPGLEKEINRILEQEKAKWSKHKP
jgi:hypothetical protein